MNTPRLPRSVSTPPGTPDSARMAGALPLFTALATLVAVIGRVAANADQPTLAESLSAISLNSGLYGLGGAARFTSGIALIASAWSLSRPRPGRQWLGTLLVPALFAASGVFTAISGACAVALAGVGT